MKSFREYIKASQQTNINEGDESKLLIKLEDGDMKIVSKQLDETKPGSFGSEKYEHIITYNGIKTVFVTNSDYEAISFKGQALDALTLFNFVIQQFYINGIVKSK